MELAELRHGADKSEWLTTAKGWRRTPCWQCDGHGVVDRGYHSPDECGTCNGSGNVWQHESGVYAKWPGGPFVA